MLTRSNFWRFPLAIIMVVGLSLVFTGCDLFDGGRDLVGPEDGTVVDTDDGVINIRDFSMIVASKPAFPVNLYGDSSTPPVLQLVAENWHEFARIPMRRAVHEGRDVWVLNGTAPANPTGRTYGYLIFGTRYSEAWITPLFTARDEKRVKQDEWDRFFVAHTDNGTAHKFTIETGGKVVRGWTVNNFADP